MLEILSQDAKNLIDEINSSAIPSKTITDLADEAFIPQGVEIPKPETIFGMDGIPVFTKKSISTLIGKAKSGKTTCTAWVVAQVIQHELKVLWIDTEQGQYYAARTQSWVLQIAKCFANPHLQFYDLKIHNPTVRTQIIESLIDKVSPDIIIIDGVRDLVFDINNPEEATIIVGNLMRWADLHDCHILSIIHQNKGNEHARGHLGSEMINKSETVIKVSQDEKKITVCEPEFTRGEPFPIFAFDRDGNGVPVLINYVAKISGGESNARKTPPIDIHETMHIECLNRAFNTSAQLAYQELIPAISASFEFYGMDMGVVRCKSFIQFYLQHGYLAKTEKVSNKTFYEQKKRSAADKNLSPIEPFSAKTEEDEPPF